MSTPILAPKSEAVKPVPNRTLATQAGLGSDELARALEQSTLTGLSLPGNLTAQAFLLGHLPLEAYERGVVWCVARASELNAAEALFRWWWHILQPSAHVPQFISFPEKFMHWLERDNAHEPRLLAVAHEHTDLALPSPENLKQQTIKLEVGLTFNPIKALGALTAAGFEPGPLPDSAGWYVRRGELLTIATDQGAWRLSWNQNRLERIEEFNLETGTAGSSRPEVTLLPARLPAVGEVTLARYLKPEHTVVGPQPSLWPDHPRRLPHDPTLEEQLLRGVPRFAGLWDELARWLALRAEHDERVVVLTAAPYRLPARLPPNVPPPQTVEVPERLVGLLNGFHDPRSRTYYLTDSELEGVRRPRAPKRLAAYERLQPGDYLVHIDHGIGRFGGLIERPREWLGHHEYFVVEYAEDDKLYVPIEHTDRLSRYLGSPHPKLERLSSAHWFQVRKKVKAETTQLARELLALYARRQNATVEGWPAQPEEELLAASFPYPLTSDQLKAWAEIASDLMGRQPMDRLICGDVGFGKTELAIRATARAVLNGHQVAVLAPTTILAQQHLDTFTRRLAPYSIKLALVSRAQSPAAIRGTLMAAAAGQVDVVIGTHRLLGADVSFKNLGLMIIDEEQRFGVKQKEHLKALKPSLHVLALSATPIPRTLNLAVSSLRDLSIILSPPQGRQAVAMKFVPEGDEVITQAVKQELKRGGQVYYLVPHVKDLPAAEHRLLRLLPHLKLGVVHGQKSPKEVALTMHRFDEGELQLLLATSIIENGLDLPNVNTLIVERAESFGLADLYQLKGRVGRGSVQAFAYFLTDAKRSEAADKRLEALAQTDELGGGLSLALRDLELRGAGAILGREQHGQVSAVGLYLYGQMLSEAIERERSGVELPAIPEVRLSLPLDGRIHPALVPQEANRIHLYQRLANVREPSELFEEAQTLLGRTLSDEPHDRLFKNLLRLLELKLYAERAHLEELRYQAKDTSGRFIIKFMSPPADECLQRLIDFDDAWHKVEGTWQAEHPLAAGAWVPWLIQSLKLLQN